MSSKIMKDWEAAEGGKFLSRFGERLKTHGTPLKDKVAFSLYRLKTQRNKLEGLTSRIQKHDERLFRKCVDSQMSKDKARASMYANECAELRKMVRTSLGCQLALDKVILRLETVKQFGDIASLMGPASSVIRSIKDQVSGLMPEVSFELNDISMNLDSIATEFGEAVDIQNVSMPENEEAQKIISEANAVADQTLKEKFPELPHTTRLTVGEIE